MNTLSRPATPYNDSPDDGPPSAAARPAPIVDLDRYVPAFFTGIANKLSNGASNAYLSAFGVGIETWRLLVWLAIEPALPAQTIARAIGMDKASVSRAFKSMQTSGLITITMDKADGRVRVASITPKGRELHDQILGLALERERAFLSVLDAQERETLVSLLLRLRNNLPVVEKATVGYLGLHYPEVKLRRTRGG